MLALRVVTARVHVVLGGSFTSKINEMVPALMWPSKSGQVLIPNVPCLDWVLNPEADTVTTTLPCLSQKQETPTTT